MLGIEVRDCDGDCRIQYSGGMTTCAYYLPIYDKYGSNINPDGSITSGTARCNTCDRTWSYSTQYGKTTYTEQPPHSCKYCGRPTWRDPADQIRPVDYCHYDDHTE